jgi:hypothetical protein
MPFLRFLGFGFAVYGGSVIARITSNWIVSLYLDEVRKSSGFQLGIATLSLWAFARVVTRHIIVFSQYIMYYKLLTSLFRCSMLYMTDYHTTGESRMHKIPPVLHTQFVACLRNKVIPNKVHVRPNRVGAREVFASLLNIDLTMTRQKFPCPSHLLTLMLCPS